jgi:hypothetical protein
MIVSRKERLLSAAIPTFLLVSSYISAWLLLVTPAILYFAFRNRSFYFASLTALRIFDLTISILIILLAVGLLNSALIIVATDGEFTIPIISSGLSKTIIIFLSVGYYLVNLVLFFIFSLRGKEFNAPISIKIFETLRGKRLVNL